MSLVIASCSNRKRVPPGARAADLPNGSLEMVGHAWLGRMEGLDCQEAAALYCGRNVRSAERAAQALNGNLLFASAGLGWVQAKQPIPSYGMTIVSGPDNVLPHIPDCVGATDWWQWLNQHSTFATSLSAAIESSTGLVLVAVPRAYLAMIEPDLLALPEALQIRLRIIQRADSELPQLAPWTVVYDERLEGGETHAGTRSDFAARAACHFVEHIWPGREVDDVRAHNAAIETALSGWTPRMARVGSRRSDEELRAIVAAHWDAAGGRTTRLLRVLRDDLGIACEQGRFARLVGEMRSERESAK